jgi:hypothetical protein
MGMLNESRASENSIEAEPRSEKTAQIYEMLQAFDVLSSEVERHVFKYAFLYFFGVSLLNLLFGIMSIWHPGITIDSVWQAFSKYAESYLLITIGISIIIWAFNIWHWSASKALQDLFNNDRISVSEGSIEIAYLEFLRGYRIALRSPRRYLFISSLMIIMAIYIYFTNHIHISLYFMNILSLKTLSFIFYMLLNFGFMYCLGVVIWTIYISGSSIRKLAQIFEFRIKPIHPDKCGGLNMLGSFCFGLVTPIFIGVAYFVGYILVALKYLKDVFTLESLAVILFLIIVYALPPIIIAFFLPLWDIHTKMLTAQEKNDESYAVDITAYREEIQNLLHGNQLGEHYSRTSKPNDKNA